MADNFQITQGSGTTIGAVDPGTGALEQKVQVTVLPAISGSVSVTNLPATQPISATALPLPNGAATAANQTNGAALSQIVDGSGHTLNIDPSGTARVNLISTITVPVSVQNPVQVAASSLIVTATGATGTAVTATLPAVVSNFHYISLIEIVKYFTVANAASATPLMVTTTNLPGPLAFTFGQPLGTIGTTDRMIHQPNSPIKSSVVNTATTIVCPATTGIIWRVNVYYFSAT